LGQKARFLLVRRTSSPRTPPVGMAKWLWEATFCSASVRKSKISRAKDPVSWQKKKGLRCHPKNASGATTLQRLPAHPPPVPCPASSEERIVGSLATQRPANEAAWVVLEGSPGCSTLQPRTSYRSDQSILAHCRRHSLRHGV
jgi:hypothetical protein